MDEHFVKFAFVAAVVLGVLISRGPYQSSMPLRDRDGVRATGTSIQSVQVPLFVLPTISASDPVAAAPAAEETRPQVVKTEPPSVSAAASLVADLRNGTVYESQNLERRWPTASITKLMTAVIAADKLDPNAQISITPQMFSVDPAESHLVIGGTYTVEDLLRTMLLPSSNVAAEALADFYGRSSFLELMNAQAASWGMADTYYGDPSGLSATNQSTADDFLKLARHLYTDYPQIFAITRTPSYLITNRASQETSAVKSINNFAGQPDFVGGKTGYTDEAGGNLLSVFKDGAEPVFIIVLGTNDRFGDTEKLYNWFKANVPA